MRTGAMKPFPDSTMTKSGSDRIVALCRFMAVAMFLIALVASAAPGDLPPITSNAPPSRVISSSPSTGATVSAAVAPAIPKAGTVQLEARGVHDNPGFSFSLLESKKITASFQVLARQTTKGSLSIELMTAAGDQGPVRLNLAENGKITAVHGKKILSLKSYPANQWLTFKIEADANRGRYTVWLNGRPLVRNAAFTERTGAPLRRIFFRASHAGSTGAGAKTPVEAVVYLVQHVKAVP